MFDHSFVGFVRIRELVFVVNIVGIRRGDIFAVDCAFFIQVILLDTIEEFTGVTIIDKGLL